MRCRSSAHVASGSSIGSGISANRLPKSLGLVGCTFHPAACDLSDSPPMAFRRYPVALRRREFGSLISIALTHHAHPASKPIHMIDCTAAPVVSWRIPNGNPNHGQLRGKDRELKQRRQFISALGSRIRECRGNLILPALLKPEGERRLHKGLEYR